MAAALITLIVLAIAALAAGHILGMTAESQADLLRHTTTSIFATLLVLLAHSMTMFYLIGKGRAIREAVTEGGLSRQFVADVSRLRRPVFSRGTLAMAVTMTAAILGGGVDTGAVPRVLHTLFAYTALLANLAALHVEVTALAGSSRITAQVNRLLRA